MAGDIRKSVVSSLKCVLAETKITGSHDVELHISVHIEEERSPSFVDLVRQGIIQCKNFGLQVCERNVPEGCRRCGKDMVCGDRELELVVSVADTNMVCDKCTVENKVQTSCTERCHELTKRRHQFRENSGSISNLLLHSPMVVLERLDDVNSLDHKFTSVSSTGEVSSPQSVTRYLYGSSVSPELQDRSRQSQTSASSNQVKRSSRASKGQPESSKKSSNGCLSSVNESDSVIQGDSGSLHSKNNHVAISRKKALLSSDSNKCWKQSQLQTTSKKRKTIPDDQSLDLVESDDEDYNKLNAEVDDPDFEISDVEGVVEDESSDKDASSTKRSETRTLERSAIKKEQEDMTGTGGVEDLLAEDAFLMKKETYSTVSDSNILSQGVQIITVQVPNVHQEEFQCPLCYKSYSLRHCMRRHLNKAGREPVLCGICGAKFHNQKDVEQHKLAHSGINQYMCAVCLKSFANKPEVDKHIKCHLPHHERPYICATCGKGFTEKNSLQEHTYRHADDKPYKCPKCDLTFAARHHLHAHLRYHSTRLYKCYTCNKTYKLFASLREHLHVYKDHYTNDEPEPLIKVPFIESEDTKQKRRKKNKAFIQKRLDEMKKLEESLRKKTITDASGDVDVDQENSIGKSSQNESKTPSVVDSAEPVSIKAEIESFNGDMTESVKQDEGEKKDTLHEKLPESHFTKHVYRCDTCDKVYENPSSLMEHLKNFSHSSMALETKPKLLLNVNSEPSKKNEKTKHGLKSSQNCGDFRCGECGEHFERKGTLKRHKSLHHGVCKNQCHVCQKNFSCPSELERHLLTHFGERSFKCDQCPKAFYHEFGLKRHMKIHIAKEKLPHGCDYCGKRFIEACYLREHLRRHTGENPFRCEVCEKGFTTKFILKGHMLSHGPKSHKCSECGKCFAYKSNFKSHMQMHQGLTVVKYDYLCDDCGKSFRSKGALNRHMTKHSGVRGYKCLHPGCSKSFYFNNELRNHQRYHTSGKPFQCEVCGKSFKYQNSLCKHRLTHKKIPPVKCEICSKEFHSSHRLKEHMQRHLGERVLECNQCDKRFITERDLNFHKKQHLETFECQDCHKIYKLEAQIKTHRKIHEGPERVQCPRCEVFYKDLMYLQTTHLKFCDPKKICNFCGRGFTNNRKLQSHIGFHTGKRPHQCDDCGTAFTEVDGLVKHQERHKKKRFPCLKCDRRFDWAWDLKKHEELHQKKELERKRIEQYKYQLLLDQTQSGYKTFSPQRGATASASFQDIFVKNHAIMTKTDQTEQVENGQDIFAQAAASINVVEEERDSSWQKEKSFRAQGLIALNTYNLLSAKVNF